MDSTVIQGRISNLDTIGECTTVGSLDPSAIVIFGASGDLTARKLIPALYRMFLNATLPDPVSIVGCSRTAYTTETFREFLQTACAAFLGDTRFDMARWHEFAARIFYFPLQYDSLQDFQNLAEFLALLDQQRNTGGNYLFDLALPPSLYTPVATMIGEAGMAVQFEQGRGWRRIVIEKLFGRDLQSALALDQALHQYFQERQIFRIDHYLAKETVLLDCILGEHMLFWRQDGVEQSWALLTPLLEECESCQRRGRRLHSYAAGSWGPEKARAIVETMIK